MIFFLLSLPVVLLLFCHYYCVFVRVCMQWNVHYTMCHVQCVMPPSQSRLPLPSSGFQCFVHCFSCFHVIIFKSTNTWEHLDHHKAYPCSNETTATTIYHNELGYIFFSLQWKWIEFSILAESSFLKLKSYGKNQTEPHQIKRDEWRMIENMLTFKRCYCCCLVRKKEFFRGRIHFVDVLV